MPTILNRRRPARFQRQQPDEVERKSISTQNILILKLTLQSRLFCSNPSLSSSFWFWSTGPSSSPLRMLMHTHARCATVLATNRPCSTYACLKIWPPFDLVLPGLLRVLLVFILPNLIHQRDSMGRSIDSCLFYATGPATTVAVTPVKLLLLFFFCLAFFDFANFLMLLRKKNYWENHCLKLLVGTNGRNY